MKGRRILVLVHEDLVPPESKRGHSVREMQDWKTEYAVVNTLRRIGHEVRVVGVADDLMPIRRAVEEQGTELVFNLLMEFQDVGFYQAHVASYLELLNVPFTGCNALGILLARDKAVAKKVLRYHRVPTPSFAVFRRGQRAGPRRGLRFPLIVKSLDEEASFGISQASVVYDAEHLAERVAFVHEKTAGDAIAEEYIEGRELTVGVIGNERLAAFPVWELFFENLPEGSLPIATEKAKFDLNYQKRNRVKSGPADPMPERQQAEIQRLARRVYRVLNLSGYARLDLRLTPDGIPFVIEANATPDIADDEDLARAAQAAGVSYESLLQRIVQLGLSYRPRWRSA